MISRKEMIPLILEADPTFEPKWRGYCEEWSDEAEIPLYGALSILAQHLASKLVSRETTRFPAVFDVVERWHVEGEHYVREAATIGLLESLQNETSASEFERWLKPASAHAWDQLNLFWSKIPSIKDFLAQNSN